jgi:hypothetical protein
MRDSDYIKNAKINSATEILKSYMSNFNDLKTLTNISDLDRTVQMACTFLQQQFVTQDKTKAVPIGYIELPGCV